MLGRCLEVGPGGAEGKMRIKEFAQPRGFIICAPVEILLG
jgi:hypothetical protein